jgi:hypothetical protein
VDGPGYYTWGELSFDRDLDLVNSVRIQTYDEASGTVDITLLDPLSTSVPPLSSGSHPLSLWRIESSFDMTDVDLIVRYDAAMAALWQKAEADLALWVLGSDGWEALSGETSGIDTTKHLLWGTAINPTYFAVAFPTDNVESLASVQAVVSNTPEPLTASGISLIALAGLLRRRRR